MNMQIEIPSYVRVEKVSLRGPGVIILTGPSSCGKGEVANALSEIMSIPKEAHLSMGEILRDTVTNSKSDLSFQQRLESVYSLSNQSNIFSCLDTTEELSRKVRSYLPALQRYFQRENMAEFTSQLEWLEFCTMQGLLVPNRWTKAFIEAHIDHNPRFSAEPFILDGYPRTVNAAEHLLGFLNSRGIPIIKVLHLSISKQEMLSRARLRNRADDDEDSLLSRYNFYVESVQPSVDYLKRELGSDKIALIDAHQPVYIETNGVKEFQLEESINNVVVSALRSLGAPRITVKDLIEARARSQRVIKSNN